LHPSADVPEEGVVLVLGRGICGIVFPLSREPIIDLTSGSKPAPLSPPISGFSNALITSLGSFYVGCRYCGRRPGIRRMLEIL